MVNINKNIKGNLWNMAKNLTYKRTTTTKLQGNGFLDTDNNTIEIDGVEKNLSELLKDFNGVEISFTVSVKEEEILED